MGISNAVYTVGQAALNNVVQVDLKKDIPLFLQGDVPEDQEQIIEFTAAGSRAVIDAVWGLLIKQQKGIA